MLIWALASCDHGSGDQITIFTGDCGKTRRISAGAHVVINILSTLLLATSNACMQSLNAPTRSEIDKAHERGIWLDIGTQSLRNFRYLPFKRGILYLMLGASSIPLHMLLVTCTKHRSHANLVPATSPLSSIAPWRMTTMPIQRRAKSNRGSPSTRS